MKSNLAPFKLLGTLSLILPWALAGTGLRSPTLVELAEGFADWFLWSVELSRVRRKPVLQEMCQGFLWVLSVDP